MKVTRKLRDPARTVLVVLVLLLIVVLTARPARAEPNVFLVNSLGDASDADIDDRLCDTGNFVTRGDSVEQECTLRAAIQEANATANVDGPDEIGFVVTGTINLTGALPDLASDMELRNGQEADVTVRRDTGGDYRIFTVSGGSTVVIDNLVIRNGSANTRSSILGGSGGGILVNGAGNTLNLIDSTIWGNWAFYCGGGVFNDEGMLAVANSRIGGGDLFTSNVARADGGGIYNGAGVVTVTDSSRIFGNQAGLYGGGVFNLYRGTLSVTNSTIGNNSSLSGGGIFNDAYDQGDSGIPGTATILNSTVSGNRADTASGGIHIGPRGMTALNSTISGNSAPAAGGIGTNTSSSATLRNTLVALNTATTRQSHDVGGNVSSAGNNLIGDGSGASGLADGVNGDQVGSASNPIDPLLETNTDGSPKLADNGGPTFTIALRPGSPAIDRGSDAVLGPPDNLTTDQRGTGFDRKRGASVDVGAFEVQNQPPVAQDQSVTTEKDTAKLLTLSATDGDPLTYEVASLPQHGKLYKGDSTADEISSGDTPLPGDQLTYKPSTDYVGPDSFDFAAVAGADSTDTATVSVTISDTIAPRVVAVSPTGRNMDAERNVRATFSEAMARDTLTDTTVRLVKRGAGRAVAADITYNPNTKWVTLDPRRSLHAGATYRATITTGAEDLAGNALATKKTWSFKVRE